MRLIRGPVRSGGARATSAPGREPRRQPGGPVALGRVEPGLGEEQAPGEVGAAQVRVPQVGPDQVGRPQSASVRSAAMR